MGLEIPIICIPTLDSLLAQGRLKHPEKVICAMLDARRMEVYTKTLSPKGSTVHELQAIVIEENTFLDQAPFIYFGDGAPKVQKLWKTRKAVLDPSIKISATGQIKLALRRYLDQKFDDLSFCKPLYLKPFGINI